MPKITIVIPIYNAEQYLDRCLSSVVKQTLQDIEVICINDGSSDNSLNIIKNYMNNYPVIKLINKKNEGVSIARNIGIETSTSKYLYFMDADDYIEPNCLEILYNSIAEHDADIVYFGANIFTNNEFNYSYNLEELVKLQDKNEMFRKMTYAVWNKLYKKEFLTKNNILFPIGIKTSEDNIFNEICHFYKPQYYILNKALYNYYEFNNGSITSLPLVALDHEIDAFGYIIGTHEYNKSDNEFKKIVLHRHINGLLYYAKRITKFKNILLARKKIKKFLNEANINCISEVDNMFQLNNFLYPYAPQKMLKLLFSITNSCDKKHKLVTILGIKFNFRRRKYKSNNKLFKSINDNYLANIKRISKKIKNNDKIEVIFLVNEISKWKCATLFNKLNESKYFNVSIAVTIADRQWELPLNEKINILNNLFTYFSASHQNVYYAYDIDKDCAIELDKFKADIIFFQQPYELDCKQNVEYASKMALTYYIPYYLPDYFIPELEYGHDFHRMVYRYYLFNDEHVETLYKSVSKKTKHLNNLYGLGHPFIDYIKQKYTIKTCEDYVIYAPHWSITEKGNENIINISTFNHNGQYILNYAKKHPELKWVFKPHPTLKNALMHIGKTQTEIENYYKEWEKFAICCYDNNYVDLFRKSKVLITDCGSFCLEYFCTGKPLIHLVSSHCTNKHHNFLEDMFNSFYNVTSNNELSEIFQQILIDNIDEKKEERYSILEQMNLLNNNASLNILRDIENTLGIEELK